MAVKAWSDVFKAAVKLAGELRKKNAKLTVAESMSAAWKDASILKMKAEYQVLKAKGLVKPAAKKKPKKGKSEGGAKKAKKAKK